jgi:hypothetical protein
MDRTSVPKPLLEAFSLALSLDFHVSSLLANANKKKAFQRGSISLRKMSDFACKGRKKEEERLETFERLKNQPTGAAPR